MSGGGKKAARLLWLLFSLFVVYGTTIPFRFDSRAMPLSARLARIDWAWISYQYGSVSVGDVVQNVLLFIPFGFLGYASLRGRRSAIGLVLLTVAGAALSMLVEFLQLFSETRHSSLSDVLFNTLGAASGVALAAVLKNSAAGIKSHPRIRGFLDSESVYPLFVFLILAAAGAWGPFDFSLDVGLAWAKVKPLIHNPFVFTLPNDDAANFIRFLLLSLFACRLAKEAGLSKPAASGLFFGAALGICLEAGQMIIQSRSPELQDALVNVAGALAGGLAFRFPGFRERPRLWISCGALAVLVAAGMRGMYPYRLSGHHQGFNWVPFLPHYERTSLATLDNFMANAMLYFPLGFLAAYFFPGRKQAAWTAAALAAASALAVEWAQGWMEGRYSDVTDVLGALLGSVAGTMVVWRGWPAFRAYLREEGGPR